MRIFQVLIFIAITLISCDKTNYPIKILDEPVTLITEEPNRIDSSMYEYLIHSFGIVDSSYYEYLGEIDSLTYEEILHSDNRITEVPDYCGALSPKYNMAVFNFRHFPGEGIRRWGGLLSICENLIIELNGQYILLDSQDDFKQHFQPIESEEEALGYVAFATNTKLRYSFAIEEDFRCYVNKINKSYAQEREDGYETMSFYYNFFGCGPHSYYSVKNFVDHEGNISERETLIMYENPDLDGLCVD